MKTRAVTILATLLAGGMGSAVPAEDPPAKKVLPGEEYRLEIQAVPASEKRRWDGTYQVSRSGWIELPYIGKVWVAGKTPMHAAKTIESHLRTKEIFTRPGIQLDLVIPKGQ